MTSFDRAEAQHDRERAESCPYCGNGPGRCTCDEGYCEDCDDNPCCCVEEDDEP